MQNKPRMVALNKIDLPEARENAQLFIAALAKESDLEVLLISAATTEGIDHLKKRVAQRVETLHESEETP
jgi:GTP-binding protein